VAKGPSYERILCRELSLWLSGGRHDDWLWRSSQSGGRATQRAKSGKRTAGHCGDLCCTCKEAEWFTKLVTVESKRGYNGSAMMADLLDRDDWPSDKHRKETMLGMIEQARDAAKRAKTPYWMLIHRRDKRQALVYLPRRFYVLCDLIDNEGAHARLWIGKETVMVLRLSQFLKEVDPKQLKRIKS
jgi:hypothetical protein